ncbi:MAG: murein biosynthesis integral membrane protein MurJ [Deltaproteobacteria bacterium]|jgi:putative peptidoglycan lipid II flippase|nr:murein biosynthesis integral membrane protein MurJ [Deltaproteobacteria bacterium]
MSEKKELTRAAGVVGGATLLSRILGFIRDMVIASFFGAGLSADAFFVAFRIPNLLRRLFAEGSLTVAFIPVFTEYLAGRGRKDALELAGSVFHLLSLILTAVTLLGILFAPLIVRVMAPGFALSAEKYEITVLLTRIMFPYIFFIGLVALSMGILNALGHFAAPALAPVFLNLAMIVSIFTLSSVFEKPVVALAIGVLIGGALQLALQIPFLLRKGFHFWKKAPWRHPAIRRIGLLMMPAVLGSAVYQVNILVGTLLASLLAEGSISYLYYADRLVQFPLGVFAIAVGTAVLPSLSRQAAADDMDAMQDTFAYALRFVFFITIPAMIGLIVLRVPIIELLFKRGAFDAETTRLTADALLYYALGLWAFSGVRVVVSTFYALQDTKTPVKVACLSMLANIGLSLLLMGPMRHGGLALATSLSSMLNLILLVWFLRKRLGRIGAGSILKSAAISSAASVLMGCGIWLFVGMTGLAGETDFIRLILYVGLSVLGGVAIYGGLSFVFKSRELAAVAGMIGDRLRGAAKS